MKPAPCSTCGGLVVLFRETRGDEARCIMCGREPEPPAEELEFRRLAREEREFQRCTCRGDKGRGDHSRCPTCGFCWRAVIHHWPFEGAHAAGLSRPA